MWFILIKLVAVRVLLKTICSWVVLIWTHCTFRQSEARSYSALTRTAVLISGDMLDEVTAVVDGYNAYFSFSKAKTGYSGERAFYYSVRHCFLC